MHIPSRRRFLSWGLLLAVAASGAAKAESGLRLEWPEAFGEISATTYDTQRVKVGEALLRIEHLEDGNVSVVTETSITDGASTLMTALFAPVGEGRDLRPLYQASRSFDEERQPLGMLEIDHREGVARCHKPDGTQSGEISLPENDQVANVTLNLLFAPLVRKERETIDFQLFFCGLGMRVVDFEAVLTPESRRDGDHHLLEVRYGPDLGLANLIAPAFLPRLSFWFGAEAPHRWMAHRLPLYGRGPEVFVVRDGMPTGWLDDE